MPHHVTPFVEAVDHRMSTWAVELTGRSEAIDRVRQLLADAASSGAGVLLVSEPGADTEAIARDLHRRSCRASAPFVTVDCRHDRIDELLFGICRTRTSGDLEEIRRDSRLAGARGGTLFLDGIEELPASVQARLTRVVRDGEVSVDGAPTDVSCRLVASAATTIDADAEERRFRADLYRRLSIHRIDLPPLRDRSEDVGDLAICILDRLRETRGIAARGFTQAALALLAALPWPGNFVELHAVVERVAAEASGSFVQVEHVLPAIQLNRAPKPFVPTGNLREARLQFERQYITAVLQHHGWRLTEAARTLGIQRPNLYRKARQLGLTLTARKITA